MSAYKNFVTRIKKSEWLSPFPCQVKTSLPLLISFSGEHMSYLISGGGDGKCMSLKILNYHLVSLLTA